MLVDGLSDESWYKISARAMLEKLKQDAERAKRMEVKGLISAQLYGQKLGG